ncbi:MAG TPA: hypothetical protein VJ725_19610 [Thermoanaerobaculia bacterium]|nr:hypothetical protein [Thermoanaerobaculia bacterium]
MSQRLLSMSVLVLILSAGVGRAAEEPRVRTWFTVQDPGMSLTVTVPLFQRDIEDRMLTKRTGPTSPSPGQQIILRLQNYLEEDLEPGEVPRLRKNQYFIEIFAESGTAADLKAFQVDCTGPVTSLPGHAGSVRCRFDPEKLQGEASLTDLAGFVKDGVLYKIQMNAREIDPAVRDRILESIEIGAKKG